jgi:hypothetical protein
MSAKAAHNSQEQGGAKMSAHEKDGLGDGLNNSMSARNTFVINW